MFGIIYCIQNLVNGKVYVGLTTKTLEKRWKQHIADAESTGPTAQYALHRALKKYGIAQFNYYVVDQAESEEELKQKEIYYIQFYHSYTNDPEGGGYNMTYGGDLNLHIKGENSPVSKNTNEQRWKVIELLLTTNMFMKDIAIHAGLNSNDGEKLVSEINRGHIFAQPQLKYPLRARAATRTGSLNPAAHDEEVILRIINLLSETNKTQAEIAEECGVHYNTVSNINRCKSWTHLHCFHSNIRQEARKKRLTDLK